MDLTDIYGNTSGDWTGAIAALAGIEGNLSKDPLFCDWQHGNYGIAANSPCAPSTLHDLIGAGEVSCAAVPPPVLLSVEDIPADQGYQARLTWYRSGHDEAGSPFPVVGYDVFRRVDPTAKAARTDSGAKLLGWDYLLRVPARGDQGYQVVVPTLCNAAADGTPFPSVFMVSAVTADPLVFFDSVPDSGSSVDNLAPGTPAGLAVSYAAAANRITWTPPDDPDVVRYELWRAGSAVPAEDPGEPTVVVTGTEWLDTGFTGSAWDQIYWVAAVDVAGNRGPLTVWSVAGISGIDGGSVPRIFALHGNVPNPFNPATSIGFDLPQAARVDLDVYDLAGRHVRRLVAGTTLSAGRHERIWDARDDAGLSVGSGVYLYRLEAGDFRESGRMVLVR